VIDHLILEEPSEVTTHGAKIMVKLKPTLQWYIKHNFLAIEDPDEPGDEDGFSIIFMEGSDVCVDSWTRDFLNFTNLVIDYDGDIVKGKAYPPQHKKLIII
jgi:hypothetical protein